MTTIPREHNTKRPINSKWSLPLIFLLFTANSSCQSTVQKSKTWYHADLNLSMVFIPTEDFETGVSAFWLGVTEVTQEQWKNIMGEAELHPEKPSPFWGLNSKMPKVSISLYDVERFIDSINVKTGIKFRLPSAKEWEYACSAGATTNFHYGQTLSWDEANFNSTYKTPFAANGPSTKRPVPVASYKPNAFGIYDMHGNVYEWTSSKDATLNEIDKDMHRADNCFIIKGGSWAFGAERAQIKKNISHRASLWGHSIGFRLATDSIQFDKKNQKENEKH